MHKTKFQIQGMHCTSCEMLIEEELKSIKGVQNARVNFKNGSAEIEADQPISDICITKAVKNAG